MNENNTMEFSLDEETEKRLVELMQDVNVDITRRFEITDKYGNTEVYEKIIHCRDCENWQTSWTASGGGHYCGMIDLETDGDFYCFFSERQSDEQIH